MMGICRVVLAATAAASVVAAESGVPVPSADVLAWTREEIGSMVTFNMATMVTNCTRNGLCVLVGGCGGWLPPVDLFDPEELDTDQWAQSLKAFGATYSVLVAQHCSGFSMFPQFEAVKKATGFEYTYGVEFTKWGSGKRDIAAEFVASCVKYGIKPAFYYSLNHNYYLRGRRVAYAAGLLSLEKEGRRAPPVAGIRPTASCSPGPWCPDR